VILDDLTLDSVHVDGLRRTMRRGLRFVKR